MNSNEALQQTILRSEMSPGTRERLLKTLAERWPHAYTAALIGAAVTALSLPLAFPLLALYMLAQAIEQLTLIGSGFDWQVLMTSLAIAAGAGYMTVYLLRLHIPMPIGRKLDVWEAPLLYPLIDDLVKSFKAPRIHQVLLSNDYELRLQRTPVSGYPYRCRNTLVIGLPVLESLSTSQLQVLLAREIGYLAHGRKRVGAWLALTGEILDEYRAFFARGWGPQQLLMRAFYNVTAPMYRAFSRLHCRREQLIADQHAMDLINDAVVVDALVAHHFTQYMLRHRFWPNLFNAAKQLPNPKYLPYSTIAPFMKKTREKGATAYWLNHVLAKYSIDRESPTLHEHLDAIGHRVVTPLKNIERNAAAQLLGDKAAAIRRQLDHQWLDNNLGEWQRRYSESRAEWERMKKLIARAQAGELESEEAWACAQLIQKNLGDQKEVSHYFKALLKACPNCAKLHYFIGRHLLSGNDRDGIRALESAMRLDNNYAQEGYQLITRYLMRTGRRQDAQEYRRKALAHQVDAA